MSNGSKQKKILVIEDDTVIQTLYTDLLGKEGYLALLAGTVDQALDQLKKETPDLILLDIMLPGGKNGYDFLEMVQKDPKWNQIPILVLSNLNKEKQSGTEMGVVEWLVKANVSAPQVVEKIKSSLS